MKKIKLNNLSARKMSEKQMGVVNGGYDTCECSCYYEGQKGGSSVMANHIANSREGLHSIKGEVKQVGAATEEHCKEKS